MTQSRPGRTARWVIGLSVTTVLALTAVAFGLVALIGSVSDTALSGVGDDDRTNVITTATVLDVDAFSYDDDPVPLDSDWSDTDGYAEIDIDFRVGTEREVTMLEWPAARPLPQVGDVLRIGYDPTDPEYDPQLADAAQLPKTQPPIGPDSGAGAPTVPTVPTVPTAPNWPGLVAALCAGAALLSLLATILWARRATSPAVATPTAYPNQPPYPNQPQYPGQPPYLGQPPYPNQSPVAPVWTQPAPWNQPTTWGQQPARHQPATPAPPQAPTQPSEHGHPATQPQPAPSVASDERPAPFSIPPS